MTVYIYKQVQQLFHPGRSGRDALCLYLPLAGAGLVLPAFGIRDYTQPDNNETGMN